MNKLEGSDLPIISDLPIKFAKWKDENFYQMANIEYYPKMKKYFAKYLPVEGEIKEGDMYITYPDFKIVRQCEDASYSFTKCKKVKLFLCDKDIQVGDKIRLFSNLNEEIIVPKSFMLREKGERVIDARISSFKVIGEVSPKATWVKEGDKFKYPIECTLPMMKDAGAHKAYYYIKCPTCGYFH